MGCRNEVAGKHVRPYVAWVQGQRFDIAGALAALDGVREIARGSVGGPKYRHWRQLAELPRVTIVEITAESIINAAGNVVEHNIRRVRLDVKDISCRRTRVSVLKT